MNLGIEITRIDGLGDKGFEAKTLLSGLIGIAKGIPHAQDPIPLDERNPAAVPIRKQARQFPEVGGDLGRYSLESGRKGSGCGFDGFGPRRERMALAGADSNLPGGDWPVKYPWRLLPAAAGTRSFRPSVVTGGSNPLRGRNGGYVDRDDNEWLQHYGPEGLDHWDVQHPDGTHTNVALDGEIHHGPDIF